ncbi:MAG: restriction endonuclease [Crocinitomix sp.]|nr:restriction endonuclease [Crocinitomix sp.]
MKKYIDPKKCKTFASKTPRVQKLINQTLFMLDVFGIPMNRTDRMLEKVAISFLACGNVKKLSDLKVIQDSHTNYSAGTKEIIEFVNKHFNEDISRGSYDYIKRHALDYLTPADIVFTSNPNKNNNDSTRGYCINSFYADLVKNYDDPNWETITREKLKNIVPLSKKLQRVRNLKKVKIKLPSGEKIDFSIGKHNELQKAIIEEFLPLYGHGCEVLYVGDSSVRDLHYEKHKLKKLKFPELSHEELPDIVAYSEKKNWVYLIEAVHSSGHIDELRLLRLQKLTKDCTAEVIYVTAFLDRAKFKKFITEIAWETEVWIAENPEHLIHFNGDKFMGPYKQE